MEEAEKVRNDVIDYSTMEYHGPVPGNQEIFSFFSLRFKGKALAMQAQVVRILLSHPSGGAA